MGRYDKIWEDMTIWPAADLFELCTVAVTCSYAHVLFLPQFSQETSELSFHRIVFPSFHPFPLFSDVQCRMARRETMCCACGWTSQSQPIHLIICGWHLENPKAPVGETAARREAEPLRRVPKKKTPTKNPQKWWNSLRRWRTLPSTRWCSHLLPFISFFCCHEFRSALPMRWRLFGVLVCCFQGPVLRQGAQLSLDHSQHRLQQVSHGQLS